MKEQYQAWSWAVASVMTRKGFITKLRAAFDATMAECPYDDLTDQQRLALFQASRSRLHRFVVWVNWRFYDLRRALKMQASAAVGPWWP